MTAATLETTRRRYAVFGGCIDSALALPELQALPDDAGSADWTLDVVDDAPPPLASARCTGEEALDTGAALRMWQSPAAQRLEYGDTGSYDVSPDGRRMTWYRVPGADARLVRSDVLGRVLAVAMRQRGIESLHASAVVVRAGALAFIAPRVHGKSSLAGALVRTGAALLTDDTLAVRVGVPPFALPGVAALRLAGDSARALAEVLPADAVAAAGREKLTIRLDEAARTGAPLRAVYELAPRHGGGDDDIAVRRERLPAFAGALALLRHARLGALLRGADAAALLRSLAAVASAVPVYRLDIAPGLHRLDEVARTVRGWHDEEGA